MNLAPIPPGSIKHKVLEAILELGPGATGHAIRKRHPSNEHLVSVSIDALVAATIIECNSEGSYQLTGIGKKIVRGESVESAVRSIAANRQAQAAAPPPSVPTTAPVARQMPIIPRRQRSVAEEPHSKPAQPDPSPSNSEPQEPAVAQTKECNECLKRKSIGDFYPNNAKCKRCFLDRQKKNKLDRAKAADVPAKGAAKTQVALRSNHRAQSSDLVIPAGGEIRCRTDGESYEIHQFDAVVSCSAAQLQALRDWATAQLKVRP